MHLSETSAFMSAAVEVAPLSQLFKALGEENRLRVVALLSHGELCVCHLEAALEMTQPTVSRHLSVLRHAGVVSARREGSWVYYRLADQADADCRQMLQALVVGFGSRPQLRADVERLRRTTGPTACL